MTITLYGDSILKFVLMEDGKYAANHSYERQFAEQFQVEIRNLCYFGAAADKGLSVIRRDLERGPGPGDWAVVEFGGNDCTYLWEEVAQSPEAVHECKTPPERFVARITEAVRLVRAAGAKPVLTSLPPIDPQRYFNWFTRTGLNKENILRWLGDIQILYRWSELYSRLMEQVARVEKTALVDLRTPFLRAGRVEPLLCVDGIHPNREGQKLIYDAFCSYIRSVRGQQPEAAV